MDSELKSIRIPVISRDVQKMSEEYFAVFDPAVDQLIRSFYDNTSASQAISILSERLLQKAQYSAQ